MNAQTALQKTIDLAARRGCKLKYSCARRIVRMSKGDLDIYAQVYVDDGGVWVNFDINGMSGNDPAAEFYYTLKRGLALRA